MRGSSRDFEPWRAEAAAQRPGDPDRGREQAAIEGRTAMADDAAGGGRRFEIFRSGEIPRLTEAQIMGVVVASPEQRQAMARLGAAGWSAGEETRVVFAAPGFSLVHAWFKADYPLPLHSHNADCLYYVVAGSLDLGSETLAAGDGFFVPANAAYAYTPGPDGVEVLEFRHVTGVEYRILAKGEGFWTRAVQRVTANLERWSKAKRPGRA
jgi:hypothetical protein